MSTKAFNNHPLIYWYNLKYSKNLYKYPKSALEVEFNC